MSGAIANLIRVHRWTLDERRRTLGDLERLAEKLTGDLAAIEAELVREREMATSTPDMAFAYPAFASASRQRSEKVKVSIAEVGKEIDRARRQVEAAFQELKKYELAQASTERRKQEALKRREQATLDEMGLTLHLRRRASDGR
ncbi:MAG: flagellar FliJ family protein [Tistlia sp.]|uniref:flagellar FliJ family protein n=1 Tax=Tistlia sp. TaxID=3057121 RepID=UPI0034A0F9F2